jgi:hypothetical protein
MRFEVAHLFVIGATVSLVALPDRVPPSRVLPNGGKRISRR